ncbi:MAG: DUF1905 domain-containing protein [Lachnospiraceae bacterium]|jgi:hypothetical protein|nr:DUF1905 domain-containing protein [Lachnospiraceae bacterium]
MRYFFHGRVLEQNDEYAIKIPFNVWEVCDKRGVIDADIVLDNQIIECKLFPEEKGKYKILLNAEDVSHFELDMEHKILLHVRDSIIQIHQNSPYSFENPVRVIDGMEVIIQPVHGLCSQTCIAMLAGVTIAEVMSVMGLREWQAKMGEMISALNYYGIDHSNIVIYTEGREATLPKCCIMMERMGLYSHYLVHYDGRFYDPNLPVFDEYDMSQLLGYLEVKCP